MHSLMHTLRLILRLNGMWRKIFDCTHIFGLRAIKKRAHNRNNQSDLQVMVCIEESNARYFVFSLLRALCAFVRSFDCSSIWINVQTFHWVASNQFIQCDLSVTSLNQTTIKVNEFIKWKYKAGWKKNVRTQSRLI